MVHLSYLKYLLIPIDLFHLYEKVTDFASYNKYTDKKRFIYFFTNVCLIFNHVSYTLLIYQLPKVKIFKTLLI